MLTSSGISLHGVIRMKFANFFFFLLLVSFFPPKFFFFLSSVKRGCDTFTKFYGQNIHVELFHSHTHTHIRLAPVGLDHIFNPLQVCDRSQWEGPWCEASLNAWLDLSKTQTPSLLTNSACISPFIHPTFLLQVQRNGFGICSGPTFGAQPSKHGFPSHCC